MYYYDQKQNIIKEVQDEMIAYISLSRNGNNKIKNKDFNIDIEPSKHYQYPIFYEKKDTFTSITCASKYQPDSVFIVTAKKSIIDKKLKYIMIKIAILMSGAFFFFLAVGYYLAKMSIIPLAESRNMVNRIIEDILHDLNAPMSAISVNCESLNEIISTEKEKKKVYRIVQSNKMIKFLYNNLAALVDDQISKNTLVTDISKLLMERVDFYTDLSPEVEFDFKLESLFIRINTDSILRIYDNLISNAIKYSQPNPKIKLIVHKRSLTIEDNGIGIKDCSEIFNRYYREKHVVTKSCGLGIGLSIVKRLCDESNIKIHYQDVQNGGSRLTLDFSEIK